MTSPIFYYNIGSINTTIIYIKRDLEETIRQNLHKGKVILLYGARRTGKTTLLKHILDNNHEPYLYLACDQRRIADQLTPDSLTLQSIIGKHTTILFDEAQYLHQPGLILKVLIDTFPHLTVLATGSSSFELANEVQEPLTGRHLTYHLFPLSWKEIAQKYPTLDHTFYFEEILRFGSYPELFQYTASEEKIQYLQLLTDDYLYKDIISFERVKESKKLRDLLTVLSLQIGQEVSYNELANTLALDRKTIERFIDLLEKTFVIFRLSALSRNLRSEINRKVKIYFYDTGVRNALINNFNPPNLRSDMGALFENYAVAEMIKRNRNLPYQSNWYFWRTYDQKKIDLIEEREGHLTAYECKYADKRANIRASTLSLFQKTYPGSTVTVLHPKTLMALLGT